MTTTVFDAVLKVVSSDSRWSVDLAPLGFDGLIVYVDDTGFDKVADRPTHILALAGDCEVIALWKQWWASESLSEPHPPVELPGGEKVVVSMINKATDDVDFDCGPKAAQVCSDTAKNLAIFAGSGARFAALNWDENRCPREAISYAAQHDPCTGGQYRYIDYQSHEHNLGPAVYDIDVIHREMGERGYVMELSDKKTVKLSDLNFDHAQRIRAAISAREIGARAPVSARNAFEWTDERKQRLSSVIDSIREAEAKAKMV